MILYAGDLAVGRMGANQGSVQRAVVQVLFRLSRPGQMLPMLQAELSVANILEHPGFVLRDLALSRLPREKHKSAATGHNRGDNLARLG
jgi:hypothetical protein